MGSSCPDDQTMGLSGRLGDHTALVMWREKPDVMLWFDSPGQIAPLICAGVMRCPYVLFVNGLAGEELTGLWGWKPIRNLIQ